MAEDYGVTGGDPTLSIIRTINEGGFAIVYSVPNGSFLWFLDRGRAETAAEMEMVDRFIFSGFWIDRFSLRSMNPY